MKRLALIGTKDFSQQIIGYAERTGEYQIVGYLDDLEEEGTIINGFPVLGSVDSAVALYQKGVFDCVFIAIGYSRFDIKEEYYTALKGKIPFANIIAPTAIISPKATFGEGVLINDYTTIDTGTVVEDDVVILGQTLLTHDCHIGKHTYLAGNNSIAGFADIQERCFIGIGVSIADHVTICSDCWISIGCVVSQSLNKPGKYLSKAISLMRI